MWRSRGREIRGTGEINVVEKVRVYENVHDKGKEYYGRKWKKPWGKRNRILPDPYWFKFIGDKTLYQEFKEESKRVHFTY